MEIDMGKTKSIVRWSNLGDGKEPRNGYDGDAGVDLYVAQSRWVGPGETLDIPHAICVEMPKGMWGMIVARSSTTRSRNLFVNMGIIDNGYRGELFTSVTNLGEENHLVGYGERISQLVWMVLASVVMVESGRLTESDRGTAGFGSSGR